MKQYLTRVSVRQMKEQHNETKCSVKRRKKEVRNTGYVVSCSNRSYHLYIIIPLCLFSSPRCSGLPLHFSMPTCFCVTRGCYSSGGKNPISHKSLGRNVDGRMYKAHTLADKQAAFRVAEENAELALTTQIEEITTHLSASVLVDNVSGPSLVPGGPLWSRNGSEDHQSNNDLSSSIKQTGGPSFLRPILL